MALTSNTNESGEDWKLIRAALDKGDEKAYARLFKKFRERVYRSIYQMVKNAEVAEDLLMGTFARAFKNLSTYQPTHSLLSWLLTIARNHTLDFLRKKTPDSISLDTEADPESGRTLLQVEDPEPDPGGEIEHAEMSRNLHLLLNHLKPHYKRLIELRYFEEYSYEQIAAELDIPVNRVKVQLFRAKELLYQIVKNKRDQL